MIPETWTRYSYVRVSLTHICLVLYWLFSCIGYLLGCTTRYSVTPFPIPFCMHRSAIHLLYYSVDRGRSVASVRYRLHRSQCPPFQRDSYSDVLYSVTSYSAKCIRQFFMCAVLYSVALYSAALFALHRSLLMCIRSLLILSVVFAHP